MLGGAFNLNYEIDRYQEIIDTLGYEKPISVDVIRIPMASRGKAFLRSAFAKSVKP
jgi:hypothetical protein